MIKAIIFDADGVLINGEMFSVQLARDYGISTDTTLPFFTGEFRDCLIGKADLKDVLPKHLKEWGWEKSVDDFLDYWFKSEHNIDLDLIQFIKELREKGIKCYLATNQEKHRVEYMLNKMEFSKVFDKVFASAHLGHKKPTFEFYAKVMDDLGTTNKNEVLFWDDTQEYVDGAKEFGINAELYTTFNDFKHKMDHYLSIEQVDVVDEHGNVLYLTSKLEAHKKGLLHKTVIAEVVNSKGELLLIKPYSHKQDAGQYVSPVGGHVSAGESDEEALKREVAEEIGITDFTYKLKGKGIFNRQVLGRHENHYFYVYETYSDQEPMLGDEAETCKWFTMDELKQELKSHPERFGDAYFFVIKTCYPELL